MEQLVTLITGGNGGIGFEVAKSLLLSSASYHVIIGSRDQERGEAALALLSNLAELKGTVSFIQLDVTDDASVDAAAASIMASHGRLDVLVNNAGIVVRGEARDAARRIFQTNVIGYISVTEAFLPLLRQAPKPRLVFLSSSLGSLTHASNPESKYYASRATEYRAATAARNMIMNQYWVRLQQEGGGGGKFLVHGADPGLVATNLFDTPEQLRARGAAEPEVGGERVASIIRGERDADAGRVCAEYGVVPW